MKIVGKKAMVTFRDIKEGGCFVYMGELYIKTWATGKATQLACGSMAGFDMDAIVSAVDAEVHIK